MAYTHCLSLIIADADSLVDVLKQLVPINKWIDLGLVLGLKKHTLDQIKLQNHDDISGCKREMVVSWLNGVDHCTPSWKSLTDGLRHAIVDRKDIAVDIERCRGH